MKLLKRIPLWAWPIIALALLVGLFLLPGGNKATFDVSGEFLLHPLIRLPKIGPVDLSITKPVVYLWITVLVVCLFAAFVNRGLKTKPGRLQVAMEGLYELARDGIAGAVMKAGADTWFPYIGGAFLDAADIPEADWVAKWNGSAWSASSRCRSASATSSPSTPPPATST